MWAVAETIRVAGGVLHRGQSPDGSAIAEAVSVASATLRALSGVKYLFLASDLRQINSAFDFF